MFWMIAAILVFSWLLGLVIHHTMGRHPPLPGAPAAGVHPPRLLSSRSLTEPHLCPAPFAIRHDESTNATRATTERDLNEHGVSTGDRK